MTTSRILTKEERIKEQIEASFELKKSHLQLHINQSNSILKERIKTGYPNENGKWVRVKAASSFIGDEQDIYDYILGFLTSEDTIRSIIRWLDNSSSTNLVLMAKMPSNISGKGYIYGRAHNWENGPIVCDYAEFHLLRSANQYEILKIITVCPHINFMKI